MRRASRLLAGLALGCSMMSAAAQEEKSQVVKINDFKNPQMHSYRAVVAGLDMFDKQHRLAPAVPGLRFRFQMRGDRPEPDAAPLLRIAGDEFSQHIPIGPDGRFSVPRYEQAIDEDAVLIMNRKKYTYRIGPEVRTPGLPDNVRRLGDLRLECQVVVAIAKNEAPFWVVVAGNSLLLTGDWCNKLMGEGAGFPFAAEAKLSAATMVRGERRLALKIEKRNYTVPIADASWDDDTLVELSFAAP